MSNKYSYRFSKVYIQIMFVLSENICSRVYQVSRDVLEELLFMKTLAVFIFLYLQMI